MASNQARFTVIYSSSRAGNEAIISGMIFDMILSSRISSVRDETVRGMRLWIDDRSSLVKELQGDVALGILR